MINYNCVLKNLNLHYNQIRFKGGVAIFENLIENTTLQYLDMSWNALGKDSTNETADALSKMLKKNTGLVHADFSYNYFTKQECEILSQGIKSNHTLYGIHMIGNQCTVD
jgi:Ran GTPase-activating protein (RanGAP) involved in mRNA processing and transport